jgi:hypothetical protein
MSKIFAILAIFGLFLVSCGSDSDSPVEPDPEVSYSFVYKQGIPTEGGADFEAFEIGGQPYLAVANANDGSNVNIDSKIYWWDAGDSFAIFQLIPTSQASDWEYFEMGGESYLAVANLSDGSTTNIDSKIYKWSGASFMESQSIPTSGAIDWEYFEIGTESYLAVANEHSDYNYNIESRIYRWDVDRFVEFQSIPTNGALDWEFFIAGPDSFLAVANGMNGSTWNLDSKIYRWNGSSFVEFQSIPTNRARSWEYFEIGGDIYLAVANFSNETTQDIDSKIYLWNGMSFSEYQSIPTNGATDLEYFSIDGDSYLAAANYFSTSADSYNIDSNIYLWNGTSFLIHQGVATIGAQDWEHFVIAGDHYLGCANLRNESEFQIDSIILKGIAD